MAMFDDRCVICGRVLYPDEIGVCDDCRDYEAEQDELWADG